MILMLIVVFFCSFVVVAINDPPGRCDLDIGVSSFASFLLTVALIFVVVILIFMVLVAITSDPPTSIASDLPTCGLGYNCL